MKAYQFISGRHEGHFKIVDSMGSSIWLSHAEAEELYRQLATEFAGRNIRKFKAKVKNRDKATS